MAAADDRDSVGDVGSEPVDPWDAVAESWQTDPGPRVYARHAFASLNAALAEHQRDLVGMQVLDFGAGTGLLTEYLQPLARHVVALDTSQQMRHHLAARAAAWPNVTVAATLSEVAPGGFGLVVCSSVLGFVRDYPATVASLVGLVDPGGVFVQWDWPPNPDDDQGQEDRHGLGAAEMHEVLSGAGLVEVSVVEAFTITVDDEAMTPLRGVGVLPVGP